MFSLTTEERRVILFLITIVLLGLCADFLIKKNSLLRSAVCSAQNSGKVNLNSADQQSLVGISGIGERLARRIIEYREQDGSFSATDELKRIKGISANKYEKIKDYFTAE